MESKEIQIREYKFKINKLSFLGQCNLRRLAKGIGPGNWLIGVADDDLIKAQTKFYDRANKQWINIPDNVFDDFSSEEGKELLNAVNQFNENFQKVQPNGQSQ